ncbi:hypothetical protein FB451DRAFT_1193737 [Mycena latifolia]|nr:hypothetical protein FB451DRAFT_1193737 [Mycena latifolia]
MQFFSFVVLALACIAQTAVMASPIEEAPAITPPTSVDCCIPYLYGLCLVPLNCRPGNPHLTPLVLVLATRNLVDNFGHGVGRGLEMDYDDGQQRPVYVSSSLAAILPSFGSGASLKILVRDHVHGSSAFLSLDQLARAFVSNLYLRLTMLIRQTKSKRPRGSA